MLDQGGIVNGGDMTVAATIAKLSYLIGKNVIIYIKNKIKKYLF